MALLQPGTALSLHCFVVFFPILFDVDLGRKVAHRDKLTLTDQPFCR